MEVSTGAGAEGEARGLLLFLEVLEREETGRTVAWSFLLSFNLMAGAGQAVPGTVVTGGSIATPGGPQGTTGSIGPVGPTGPIGVTGPPAVTTTSAPFTVPNIGSTITVTVLDASWVVLGQVVNVANAGGTGLAGSFQVTGKTGNQLTLLNPATLATIPPADSTQAGLLNRLSGNATDYVGGDNACHVLSGGSVRSFNAVGNPNFEVRQRNIGAQLTNFSGYLEDRWGVSTGGSTSVKWQVLPVTDAVGTGIAIPGTTFPISTSFLRCTVNTQKASLAAGDLVSCYQFPEGPSFRELMNDVHSVSILARSSVANLIFGMSLQDPGESYILAKQCPLGAANTWTLIQLPNIPIWTSLGNFSSRPGLPGYWLTLCFAGGSNYLTPSNDTWIAVASQMGAFGQSNFLANAVGSTVDIAFVQHEPGAVCNPLIDKPFIQNLDECERYYQKTYPYGIKAGTSGASALAPVATNSLANTNLWGPFRFYKRMAKTPTIVTYSDITGTSATVRDNNASVDRTVSAYLLAGDSGFSGLTLATLNASAAFYTLHWTADTNW
jgi:hypothetical protein